MKKALITGQDGSYLAEVDLLIGDPAKAQARLDGEPKAALRARGREGH